MFLKQMSKELEQIFKRHLGAINIKILLQKGIDPLCINVKQWLTFKTDLNLFCSKFLSIKGILTIRRIILYKTEYDSTEWINYLLDTIGK